MATPSSDELTKMCATGAALHGATATGSSLKLTLTTTGPWWVTCDTDCYLLQGETGGSASFPSGGASSPPLWQKTYRRIYVTDLTTNGFIHLRAQSSAGNAWAWQDKGE